MELYLKKPVYDENTGMAVIGKKASFCEVVAFLKTKKEKYLGCDLVTPNVTALRFREYTCYYNEEKKTLCVYPASAYNKYFRVKGWKELMEGDAAYV